MMANITQTLTKVTGARETSPRQVQMPNPVTATFDADDTDNYDARLEGWGKGRFSVVVDNPANDIVTATVYGMFSSDGDVGDADVFEIGSFTVAAADKGYETVNDPFPWYLVRLNYASAPTDTPAETCSLFVAPSAF